MLDINLNISKKVKIIILIQYNSYANYKSLFFGLQWKPLVMIV